MMVLQCMLDLKKDVGEGQGSIWGLVEVWSTRHVDEHTTPSDKDQFDCNDCIAKSSWIPCIHEQRTTFMTAIVFNLWIAY